MENKISKYIMKLIFSNMTEKNQLWLIIYNKNLQNRLNKILINYKIFIGKYIIHEINTIGKIYDAYTNYLIFEGKLLNNKKIWKGDEYHPNGNLKFEGEYLMEKEKEKVKNMI